MTELQVSAAWGGALLLWLLQCGLAVALVAISALNPIALERIRSENAARFAFVAQLDQPWGAYRMAAGIARLLCLVGATALCMLGTYGAGLARPFLVGSAVGLGVGVVLIEMLLARSIGVVAPRRALKATAFLVAFARRLLFPAVAPWAALLTRMAGRHDGSEERSEEDQEEEVEALIEVGERSGLLEGEEGEMVRGIVDLDETAVREIMTPIGDVRMLEAEASVPEARRHLIDVAHTRIPVHGESRDEIVGILHVRDLLRAWQDGDTGAIRPYLRAATFAEESDSAADLLHLMRVKTKIAMVMNEFGGVAGVVTLEDLLEEIVGEIRDEDAPDEAEEVQAMADGAHRVLAVAHVDRLTEHYGLTFEERDFDTVGGWIVAHLGRVPRSGESFELDGIDIEVLAADPRRIRQVLLRRGDSGQEAAG